MHHLAQLLNVLNAILLYYLAYLLKKPLEILNDKIHNLYHLERWNFGLLDQSLSYQILNKVFGSIRLGVLFICGISNSKVVKAISSHLVFKIMIDVQPIKKYPITGLIFFTEYITIHVQQYMAYSKPPGPEKPFIRTKLHYIYYTLCYFPSIGKRKYCNNHEFTTCSL